METYYGTYDECTVCGGEILWMAGGLFWLHTGPRDCHLGVPKRLTDLKTHESVIASFEKRRRDERTGT